ncbi:hypothetical protein ABZX51_005295 [Aspergillus tubingensis]
MDSIKKAVHVSSWWIVTMAKGTRRPKRYMPVSMKFNFVPCHETKNIRPERNVPIRARFKFCMHCLRKVNANYGSAEAALYDTGYYIDDKASVLCHLSYGGKKTCEPVCWINAHHLVKIVE